MPRLNPLNRSSVDFAQVVGELAEEAYNNDTHDFTNRMRPYIIVNQVIQAYREYCEASGEMVPETIGFTSGYIRGFTYAYVMLKDEQAQKEVTK